MVRRLQTFGLRASLAFIAMTVIALFTPAGNLHAAVVHLTPEAPIWILGDTLSDPIPFDLNADGTVDMGIGKSGIQTSTTPFNGTRFVGGMPGTALNAALASGDFIGAELTDPMDWSDDGQILNGCISAGGLVCTGEFLGGRAFLGIEFRISGQVHYGWMQIQSENFFVGAGVIDWAYESEPDVPILAGQIPEPSGALLVLAGLALALRRRRG